MKRKYTKRSSKRSSKRKYKRKYTKRSTKRKYTKRSTKRKYTKRSTKRSNKRKYTKMKGGSDDDTGVVATEPDLEAMKEYADPGLVKYLEEYKSQHGMSDRVFRKVLANDIWTGEMQQVSTKSVGDVADFGRVAGLERLEPQWWGTETGRMIGQQFIEAQKEGEEQEELEAGKAERKGWWWERDQVLPWEETEYLDFSELDKMVEGEDALARQARAEAGKITRNRRDAVADPEHLAEIEEWRIHGLMNTNLPEAKSSGQLKEVVKSATSSTAREKFVKSRESS